MTIRIPAILILMTMNLLTANEIPPDSSDLHYSDYAHATITTERARFDRVIEAGSGFQFDNPGARIRFRTDATSVVARLFYNGMHQRMDAVNGIGVFRVDGRNCGSFLHVKPRPGKIAVKILAEEKTAERDCEIVLPYGDSVDFEGLTVNDGARFYPMKPRPGIRYVAYGDSITHGFRSSDVTKGYAFLMAEQKGWELVNMGFGSRRATAADGKAIAALPADVITILIGFNDHYGNKPLDQYEADMTGLLRNIRAGQPKTPIYVITPLWSTEPFPTHLGLHLEQYRAIVRKVVQTENDPNLHGIEGPDLIPHDKKFFTDGVHPNDSGFAVLAENLGPRVGIAEKEKPSNY